MIAVDEAQVVQLLQDEMAGVIEDPRPGMVVDRRQEALEGGAIVQVLARMQFEAEVDAFFAVDVEDGAPATSQLGEAFVHQTRRTLRPGIDIGPEQGAEKLATALRPRRRLPWRPA